MGMNGYVYKAIVCPDTIEKFSVLSPIEIIINLFLKGNYKPYTYEFEQQVGSF